MESNAYASESSKDSDLLQQVPITKFGLTYLAIEELQSSQEKEEGCYSQHTGKELRAPIELGEALPDSIEVQDTEGNSIGIRQWCKGGNELELSGALYGIIFTVPSMSTRTHCDGCSEQAMCFTQSLDDFEAAGAHVACLSAASLEAARSWKEMCSIPFEVFSDRSMALFEHLGALLRLNTWTHPPLAISRSYFIFEIGTGNLIRRVVGVRPKVCAELALRDIRELTGAIA